MTTEIKEPNNQQLMSIAEYLKDRLLRTPAEVSDKGVFTSTYPVGVSTPESRGYSEKGVEDDSVLDHARRRSGMGAKEAETVEGVLR